MANVLLVSKPVEPPWNDSSKNLVRDLAQALSRHQPVVLGRKGGRVLPGVRTSAIYASQSGGYAPPMADQARVLMRLAQSRNEALWHFFFAPNPRTSMAGHVLSRLKRRPTVHTICSAPRQDADLSRVLFADRNIVLSRHTEQRLHRAGARGLFRIPPSVPALDVLSDEARANARARWSLPESQLVVYPGDLEFGRGAQLVLDAVAARPSWTLAMACRLKTAAAKQEAERLRAEGEARAPGRIHWIGETPHILELIGSSDVVALPSDDLYAKMDYPLAVLEAMGLGVPVVVARGTPAAELEEGGAILADPTAESVAAALDRLEDSGLRQERAAQALRHVRSEHDAETMARRYEAIYDELAGA